MQSARNEMMKLAAKLYFFSCHYLFSWLEFAGKSYNITFVNGSGSILPSDSCGRCRALADGGVKSTRTIARHRREVQSFLCRGC